jgi:MFS family permease
VPLYPLYALLFADTGLSDAQISLLFALWSAVGITAEVPSGALADRFGRRNALVAGALTQALGFALWTALPGFPGFAAGFVLWGLGGSLASGAQEALLYDGLADVGAADRFAQVQGWVGAAGLVAQLPAAVAATVLFDAGGYPAVGWVSVGACVVTAAMAARLRDAWPRSGGGPGSPGVGSLAGEHPDGPAAPDEPDESYLATLRAGLAEVATRPAVRGAVLAFGLLFGLDAAEEYFPLVARDLGVPTALVPPALLAIPLAGAAGAALGGVANRLPPAGPAVLLGAGALALAAAAAVPHPGALAGVALFYGLYRAVLVVAATRLQERIDGPARATVTSVANFVGELPSFAVYVAWAFGGSAALAVLAAATAALLPVLLRPPPR